MPEGLTAVDLALFAGSALALIGFLFVGRIGRGGGLALLVGYAAYVAWLAVNSA